MNNIYALLIGVDFYFEHTLPDGSYFPSLGGCVRDIRHVETFLTDPARLNLPRQNILMLTATDTHGDIPAEPPEQWPTYANMVAKFKELGAMAQPGDQLYIQYSGHGGRATTVYGDLKGTSGVDEALVPLDIGDPQARYLRDVELYFLIDELVKKELRVTVVFDCCNSGGATRGLGGARKRGIGTIDTTSRPSDSLVASTQSLTAAWRQAARSTRDHKPASGWLLEPKGYTFFAACRASESAYEYPFNGSENNGALTYWMIDTLRQAGPNFTYKMLYDRVLAKVHGQFEQQTPMLQGEGDVAVFGSERIPPIYAVAVLQLDSAGNRVRLNAGDVHGVAVGTQFAVYPLGTVAFTTTANRIALLEVTHVNEADSWAKIVTQSSQGQIEEGAQAILLQSANVRLRRAVTVLIDDAATKQQVEAAITSQGSGFVEVASAGKSDFQVAINGQQTEIWDAAGVPIPNLRPPISLSDANALERLVQRLVHLAKYYAVRDLAAPDMSGAQKLEVTLESLTGEAEKEAGNAPIYRPGDKVKFAIKNTQTPGEANDPTLILNITVLDLAPDWSIKQIFPAEAAPFEPLDPGKSFEFEFEAFLADGRTQGVDTLKVFATRATTNFRWLELPALDLPQTKDAIQRAALSDPLESLLATITGERATTRDLRVTSSPQSRSWTTAQVDLRVQA